MCYFLVERAHKYTPELLHMSNHQDFKHSSVCKMFFHSPDHLSCMKLSHAEQFGFSQD